MTSDRNSQRIVIAGASSLLGSELKSLLEESKFAGWEIRLVDEVEAAGILTEVGGEAALIQTVEEESFHGAKYVFLAGSAAFAKQCIPPARASGATMIDFSRASLSDPDATPWFPKITELRGQTVAKNAKLFCIFSAGGAAISALALALRRLGSQRVVAVIHRPVSEVGRAGIEELETQTSQLLSFQSVGNTVFGTQTAFNLLPRYGAESAQDLQRSLFETRAEISAGVGEPEEDQKISVNVVHVPVFYGTTFTACVDLVESTESAAVADALKAAGFVLVPAEEAGPSNVSVAGETSIFLAEPRPDASRRGSFWLWGAADNLRVPAYSGIKLAEWLDS
ncbi:MAG TPA: Asd/ArgC dimerization domain-containing protein [Candidatus Acidoferrum sp.]